MPQLPKPFPDVGPRALASFNFADLTQNVGILKLFAANTHDGSGIKQVLTNNTSIGSLSTSDVKIAGSGTIMGNTDYVAKFNNNFPIKGDVLINVPIHVTDANNTTITITATLTHNSTTIASAFSTTSGSTATGTIKDTDAIVSMIVEDVDFRIAIGDTVTLRIAAELDGTGSPNGWVFHDPLNRTAAQSNTTSQLQLMLPVRLEL